jgi:exodeoxyribonuclease VII small subunit
MKKIAIDDLLKSAEHDALLSELPFEDGLRLLEELVQRVEGGSMPLDQAISAYERGSTLIAKLRVLLSGAEEKLRLVEQGKNSGAPEVRVVDIAQKDGAETDAASRSRKSRS